MNIQNNSVNIFFRQIVANTQNNQKMDLSEFATKKNPKSSVFYLMTYLQQLLELEDEILSMAIGLVKKMASLGVRINDNMLSKLVLTCIYLASKVYEENVFQADAFSLAAGISKKELARMELKVLEILDFNLNLKQREYEEANALLSNC